MRQELDKKKKDKQFDRMLKRWKNKVEEEGILQTFRAKEFYEKPSEKRRRKRREAVSRQKRITQEDNFDRKRMY